MKKVLCAAASLLLMFTFTLTFAAAPSASEYAYNPNVESLNVPEEYVGLRNIVHGAAYWGEKVTFETLNYSDVWGFSQILFMKLYEEDLIERPEAYATDPSLEANPNAPRIPYDTVKEAFEQCFGPDTFAKYLSSQESENYFISDGTNILTYEKSTHSFAFIYFSWKGGNAWGRGYEKFQSAEKNGDEIYLFMKYGGYSTDWDFTAATIYGDAKKTYTNQDGIVLGTGGEVSPKESESVLSRLNAGEFDEYLPVYKHTFKDNGQGGYYWVSTEMVEEGTQIPSELFPAVQEPSAEENPPAAGDSTEGEHTILGGNWGSTSTQPSTDTQQPSADDDSAPLWGVIVGCGAVAVALAVGAVLLVKRYKK